jgi:hypothetical protein
MLRRYSLISLLLVILLLMFPSVFADGHEKRQLSGHSSAASAATDDNAALLIAQHAFGNPIAAENYLFWVDLRDEEAAIYGYALARQQEFFIKRIGTPSHAVSLTSDGTTLAWIETMTSTQRIQGYDLTTQREYTIMEAPDQYGFDTITLDDGTLYYARRSPDEPGVFAYTLATARHQQISPHGFDVVAADGVLLWTEETDLDRYPRSTKSLQVLVLDGSQEPTTVVTATASYFSGYSVSGDTVVYSFLPGNSDSRVHAYDRQQGTHAPLSIGAGFYPVIQGTQVAWAGAAESADAGASRIMLLDRTTNTATPMVEQSTTKLQPRAFLVGGQLLFTVADPTTGTQALYLAETGRPGLHFQGEPNLNVFSSQDRPFGGQIGVAGRSLVVSLDPGLSERYPVHGVQFILPAYDINGETFTNGALDATGPTAEGGDGSRAFWLAKASNELHAQTLRVFVPMPGESQNPDGTKVSPEVIYRFALEAESLGMRLGIVIHNSGDFTMFGDDYEGQPLDKEGWLRELIQVFEANGNTNLIAYISADNEINNHCDWYEGDCYYAEDTLVYNGKTYAEAANLWAFNVYDIVKDENPDILVTVGMSTEVEATAGAQARALDNYFRSHDEIALEDYVDFLSPHNYGGGGYGMYQYIESRWAGPVVLEEYGYATDPYITEVNEETGEIIERTFYREGPPICRTDPWEITETGGQVREECRNTAPGFTEINIRSLQQLQEGVANYAGGVAFMLVDSTRKGDFSTCSLDSEGRTKPAFDYFTGLFAIGGDYCDGTRTQTFGAMKTTGFRVCMHHSGNNAAMCGEQVFLPLVFR